MTPKDLRARADEADRQGMEALGRDRAEALRQFARAELLRQTAAKLEGLSGQVRSVNLPRMHTDATRLNISRGRASDDFHKAVQAAGMTLRLLAEKLGVTPSLISQYRRGTKKCPRGRAEEIERLTGFRASAKNWPGGLS